MLQVKAALFILRWGLGCATQLNITILATIISFIMQAQSTMIIFVPHVMFFNKRGLMCKLVIFCQS
jgi:hypothetical protein